MVIQSESAILPRLVAARRHSAAMLSTTTVERSPGQPPVISTLAIFSTFLAESLKPPCERPQSSYGLLEPFWSRCTGKVGREALSPSCTSRVQQTRHVQQSCFTLSSLVSSAGSDSFSGRDTTK